MTDLQDALKRFDNQKVFAGDQILFVDAARLVANPNLRDRIAHTIMVYSWSTDAMQDMVSPVDAYDLTDKVLAKLTPGDTNER